MLRVSKMTDYGLVLATALAQHGENRSGSGQLSHGRASLSVRQLCERTAIPEPTVYKIMKLLTKSHIVASSRGPAGGYRLARDSAEVSVLDLLTALEGPLALTECQVHAGPVDTGCLYEGRCDVQSVWQHIHVVVRDALAAVSLADVVAQQAGAHVALEQVLPLAGLRRGHG